MARLFFAKILRVQNFSNLALAKAGYARNWPLYDRLIQRRERNQEWDNTFGTGETTVRWRLCYTDADYEMDRRGNT